MILQVADKLLLDDESGEPLFDGYALWWGPRMAVTRSQYMALFSIMALYSEREISRAQAQLCESAFVLNGWQWVDRDPPEEHSLALLDQE